MPGHHLGPVSTHPEVTCEVSEGFSGMVTHSTLLYICRCSKLACRPQFCICYAFHPLISEVASEQHSQCMLYDSAGIKKWSRIHAHFILSTFRKYIPNIAVYTKVPTVC